MLNWKEFYYSSINESTEDLIVKAYKLMTPDNQQKVNKVLESPTFGNSYSNSIQAYINSQLQKGNTPNIQDIANYMLDGIESYLRTSVSKNKNLSDRIRNDAMIRTPMPETPANQTGRFGGSQTMWSNKNARQGTVPDQEIKANKLDRYHYSVWDGSIVNAPKTYKYIYNKTNNKLIYNPNYEG